MLYDRTENEHALNILFSQQETKTQAAALSSTLIFLIHFSSRDVEMLRKSLRGSFGQFLPANWYSAPVIAKQVAKLGGNSLGDVLRGTLSGSETGAITPIHGKDFFACLRQSVFDATLGKIYFHVLGRRNMHELVAANFIDERSAEDLSISDLTTADFERMFEQTFTVSQQRAVVTAYVDAAFGPHVISTFDQWRRDPMTYFPKHFHRVGIDFIPAGNGEVEPLARKETEKRIANWFSDRLKAQIISWNSTGWPVIED